MGVSAVSMLRVLTDVSTARGVIVRRGLVVHFVAARTSVNSSLRITGHHAVYTNFVETLALPKAPQSINVRSTGS